MKKYIYLLLILIVTSVYGQEIVSFNRDITGFPKIKSSIVVFDETGTPIDNLSSSDFEIKESGNPVNNPDILIGKSVGLSKFSLILTIDASEFMSENDMTIAKASANKIAKYCVDNGIECAITSYNTFPYIHNGFETDSEILTSSISAIYRNGNSNSSNVFRDYQNGITNLLTKAKNPPVIVYITNEVTSVAPPADFISLINYKNVQLNSLTINGNANSLLKTTAFASGGCSFENINSTKEAESIVTALFRKIYGGAYEISWVSGVKCQTDLVNANIIYKPKNATFNFNYSIKSNVIPYLKIFSC